jgi:hypothetical protein
VQTFLEFVQKACVFVVAVKGSCAARTRRMLSTVLAATCSVILVRPSVPYSPGALMQHHKIKITSLSFIMLMTLPVQEFASWFLDHVTNSRKDAA